MGLLMGDLPLGLDLSHTQTQWASQLNPLLGNPIMRGLALNAISLVANVPQTLNHRLSRNQIGWIITDQNAAAEIYRTQPFNAQTITLESSANVTINIWCY
jgi:hypothetical protein